MQNCCIELLTRIGPELCRSCFECCFVSLRSDLRTVSADLLLLHRMGELWSWMEYPLFASRTLLCARVIHQSNRQLSESFQIGKLTKFFVAPTSFWKSKIQRIDDKSLAWDAEKRRWFARNRWNLKTLLGNEISLRTFFKFHIQTRKSRRSFWIPKTRDNVNRTRDSSLSFRTFSFSQRHFNIHPPKPGWMASGDKVPTETEGTPHSAGCICVSDISDVCSTVCCVSLTSLLHLTENNGCEIYAWAETRWFISITQHVVIVFPTLSNRHKSHIYLRLSRASVMPPKSEVTIECLHRR